MAWFCIIFGFSFAIAISLMLRMKKCAREVAVFVALALIGFVTWLFLFLDSPLKPSAWIAWVIDRTAL